MVERVEIRVHTNIVAGQRETLRHLFDSIGQIEQMIDRNNKFVIRAHSTGIQRIIEVIEQSNSPFVDCISISFPTMDQNVRPVLDCCQSSAAGKFLSISFRDSINSYHNHLNEATATATMHPLSELYLVMP